MTRSQLLSKAKPHTSASQRLKTRASNNVLYDSVWLDDVEYHVGQSVAVYIKDKKYSMIAMICELKGINEMIKNIKVRLLLSHNHLDKNVAKNIPTEKLFFSSIVQTINTDDILHSVDVYSKESYLEYVAKLSSTTRTRTSKKNLIDANKYFCSYYYDHNKQILGSLNWSQCTYTKNGKTLSKLIEPLYVAEIFNNNLNSKNNYINSDCSKITRRMKRLSISKKPTSITITETPKKQHTRRNKEKLTLIYMKDYEKINVNKIYEKKLNNNAFVSIEPISAKIKKHYSIHDKDFIDCKIYDQSDSDSDSDQYSSEYTNDDFSADEFDFSSDHSNYDSDFFNSDDSTHATDIPSSKVYQKNDTEYYQAISNLHVSSIPDSLPCRENECMDIFSELYEALQTNTSCCLYISGVPGTGKTATVMEVLRMISFASDQSDLPNFEFISINGMKLTEPQQLYVKLWQEITKTNSKITPNHAASNLDEYFNKNKVFSRDSSNNNSSKMLVVFVDDRPNSNLVVITVANTMDLPERMLHHKISSRLGLKRINFQPYTHEQLTQIVLSRIGESNVFDPDAVQLCARKISAVSGDARRALDACRRAVEIVESECYSSKNKDINANKTQNNQNYKYCKDKKVTIKVVEQVVREMYSYGFIPTIQNFSVSQKIFLLSVRSGLRMCGLQEVVLGEIARLHHQYTKMFDLEQLNNSQIIKIASDLNATGCIFVESEKNLGLHRMVKLNIGEDEIAVALRPDPVLGKS
ncbi:hypothetical protein BB561_006835, partial [Smittium simulii]